MSEIHGANFTQETEAARKFGVHEIELTGNGGAPNPFDTAATVRFIPPSGAANAVTVDAFYDGGNVWRARVYVMEIGRWQWRANSTDDAGLEGTSGTFESQASTLRGMLRKHRDNPRQWMTEDGQWFCNVSDTAYLLLHGQEATLWKEYVWDAVAQGVTCLRVASLGGWGGTPSAEKDHNDHWVWNDPWLGGAAPDYTRYDLDKFHTTDERLTWLLDTYPELQLQHILFSFKGYGTEDTGEWWASLPPSVRINAMRYMIARWAAFPNLFWLIVNDMHCDEKVPKNQAFAREVGRFFVANDPWKHLISTGPNRRAGFPFTTEDDLTWCSYAHVEDANAVGADALQQYHLDTAPMPVWMAEDYYEQDHSHYVDAAYFFRWLFWSWLLSGGSANYGGRWGHIHPYTWTHRKDLQWIGIEGTDYTGEQLTGLDSAPFICAYFRERNLDLAAFTPDDARATDLEGQVEKWRPKLMRRGYEEFLIYHPNAAGDSYAAQPDKQKTARLRVDLSSAKGSFQAEWYRPRDGVAQAGDTVQGGAAREFAAPWEGEDVVLRLIS